jgi:hypothetical protein
VRTWTGWHRHVLAILALPFLMACAAQRAPAPSADPWHYACHGGPIALTAAEIRRLVITPSQARLATPLRVSTCTLHWSSWRRHHQGHARQRLYQHRLAAELDP